MPMPDKRAGEGLARHFNKNSKNPMLVKRIEFEYALAGREFPRSSTEGMTWGPLPT